MKTYFLMLLFFIPILAQGQWNQNSDNSTTGRLLITGAVSSADYDDITISRNKAETGIKIFNGNTSGRSVILFGHDYGGKYGFLAHHSPLFNAGSGYTQTYKASSTILMGADINGLGIISTGDIRLSAGGDVDSKIRMVINSVGSVGIGSTAPIARLDINGTGSHVLNFTNKIIDADNLDMLSVQSLNKSSVLNLVSSRSDAGALGGLLFTTTHGWMDSHANIAGIVGGRVGTDATAGGYLSFWTKDGSGAIPRENMRITHDGKVAIGTVDPRGFKLAVAGKAVAEEVVVQLQTNWPDYVFENGYHLPSLLELEEFIVENKHLPEVPTANDVKRNGLSLGDMNAVLLKKVEELTLHMIELSKENEELRRRVEILEKK